MFLFQFSARLKRNTGNFQIFSGNLLKLPNIDSPSGLGKARVARKHARNTTGSVRPSGKPTNISCGVVMH
jgi:hypothetical protein